MSDAPAACALYTELTVGPPVTDPGVVDAVLNHPGTSMFGVISGGELVSMVTLHILPNATMNARPDALIENVVTRADQRGRGFGRLAMQSAIDAAWAENAYKIMLMTGQRRGAKGFYEACGFSGEDKYALVLRRGSGV